MTVYLIDGYNVLHELLGHAGILDLEEERTRLLVRIASYMGATIRSGYRCVRLPRSGVAKDRRVQPPMWRSISGRFYALPTAS